MRARATARFTATTAGACVVAFALAGGLAAQEDPGPLQEPTQVDDGCCGSVLHGWVSRSVC